MTAPSTIVQKFLSKPGELGVVAVGFSGGQGKPGVDTGPRALLDHGLLAQLRDDLGYSISSPAASASAHLLSPTATSHAVHSYASAIPTSDPPHRGMKNPRAVSAVTRQVASQVYEEARQGRMVLTLGGDHSIAIGTVSGTARAVRERLGRDVAVIWVDAHADINTPESSDSGNVHGMPVAFLTGLAREESEEMFGWVGAEGGNGGPTRADGAAVAATKNGAAAAAAAAAAATTTNGSAAPTGSGSGFRPPLSLSKLVYIGLRDVDRGEKAILRAHGIRAFSMHDIDAHGVGRVMELALAHIGADAPIHLSFDVDALDPQWAPSTGTPVRGGLTLREGDFIAESVAATGQLVAMDLVEVNPQLGRETRGERGVEETVGAGVSLVRCALGDTLL